MRVAHLGPCREQRVGFVEQQHRVDGARPLEDAAQVLRGLADVLAGHRRTVDPDQLQSEIGGDDLRAHRLADARRAGEQDGEALLAPEQAAHALLRPEAQPRAALVREIAQRVLQAVGQHEVVPAERGVHAVRELAERVGLRHVQGLARGAPAGGTVPPEAFEASRP